MIRASEAIPQKPLPKIHKGKVPIKASELVKQRHVAALTAMAKAIVQREEAFHRLVRAQRKVWELARQVQRYEKQNGAL